MKGPDDILRVKLGDASQDAAAGHHSVAQPLQTIQHLQEKKILKKKLLVKSSLSCQKLKKLVVFSSQAGVREGGRGRQPFLTYSQYFLRESDCETYLPSWNAELDCSLLTRLRLVTHFLCQQTDLEFSLSSKNISPAFISFQPRVLEMKNVGANLYREREESISPTLGSNLLREEWGPGPWSTSEERSP